MGFMSAAPSTMVSRYHRWFRELGYPLLDVQEYPDGEWSIIQYMKTPIIPSLTQWNHVLTGLRNIEISRGFVENYVNALDTQKKLFWDMEEFKSAQVEMEGDAKEAHAEALADRCTAAVTRNPAMMDRIAKNGVGEINLAKIARHIPKYQAPKL
jgi:hypothetical protein